MNKFNYLSIISLIFFTQSWGQQPSEATIRLLERSKMFEPQLIKVTENVYAAVGYQVSTNGFIIGKDGIIVIDPGQLISGAQNFNKVLREITDKPIKAIIYTHGHPDHYNAAGAFYSEGVEVWARNNFGSETELVRLNGYQGGVRSSNTQGFDLPIEQRIGVGVGIAMPPTNRPNLGGMGLMSDGAITNNVDGVDTSNLVSQAPARIIQPNNTFSGDRQSIEIAGVYLELVKAPGETDDHLYVWYPKEKVIFTGDNFYQSWPNTYPLRGTARRSVRDWVDSLSSMVEEKPEIVIPGHTTPMQNATEVLTNYRDALKWVLDKTVEGAKLNLTPDELVNFAQLPEHLIHLDYLQDYYGSQWGTVRDIYAQDLGWFDGNVLNLHRQTPLEQAENLADLLGGVKLLSVKVDEALRSKNYYRAAQLADAWSRLEPENYEPWFALAQSLSAIAEQTFNAPARNYTQSSANKALSTAENLME